MFVLKDLKIFFRYKDIIFIINIMNEEKLQNIHNNLKIIYGSFNDEYPEQLISATFLNGNEKVLEIGGNVGRNSLVISYLLKDSKNLVTIETNPFYTEHLKVNRDINGFNFHIETAAISNKKMFQNGWLTKQSDVLLDGFFEIPTITLEQFYDKYKIDFDTLVLDCEGAFYNILKDTPEILNNIKMIFIENDFQSSDDLMYVHNILRKNNFKVICELPHPYAIESKDFYQVWKKE